MSMNNHVFREKYRIDSTRLCGWNYAHPGAYFVTVCTKNRFPWFGTTRNGTMYASDIGRIVCEYWNEIPMHFPHVTLDAFAIMPDHVHGIIVIRRRAGEPVVETRDSRVSTPHASDIACERDATYPRAVCGRDTRERIPRPPPGSLGSIINQWKTACTKRIRVNVHDFSWQNRFYDRIIHDAHAFDTVRRYIADHPPLGRAILIFPR